MNRTNAKSRLLSIVVSVAMMVLLTSIAWADEPDAGQEITGSLEGQTYQEAEPLDNDQLFADYVDVQLGMAEAPSAPAKRSIVLDGTNYAIYCKLKDEIALVADGTNTSTVFEVAVDELGLGQTEWTAEELGVAAIVENGAITEEAQSALLNRVNIDLHAIVRALLADCPYEMYWYDKTKGAASFGPQMTASYSSSSGWTLRLSGDVTISFAVAYGYAAGDYLVNTLNIERVHHAVEKAASIVEENEGAWDDEKLVSYREAICDLVAYDQVAADDDSTPYGDSWQIISVFDEDENTNVVCEGYSKAFQYLCNLSTFEGDVSCITVTGTMFGGTGEGPHMWNIVNMEDDNNYLVDVTNCDEGTIGAPDQLFLAGCESGSVETAYTFLCNGGSVTYEYDPEIQIDYAGELDIADEGYVPGSHEYADLSEATIFAIDAQTFNGLAIEPSLTVTYENKELVEGVNYTVSYANNTKVGTATATIAGIGRFSGSNTVSFQIVAPARSSELNTGIAMSDVKYQLQSGFDSQNPPATTGVRFVAAIDGLGYQSVGLLFSASVSADDAMVVGAAGVSSYTDRYVYSSILADGDRLVAQDVFPDEGYQYLTATKLANIPSSAYNKDMYVRAFAVKMDGTVVYGDVRSFSISTGGLDVTNDFDSEFGNLN